MRWIKAAWKGEEKLWKVFWVYCVLTEFFLLPEYDFRKPFPLVLFLLSRACLIWSWVAAWRCAFNAEWRGWGYIVRGMIIMWFVLVFAGLVVGDWLISSGLIYKAECRALMRDDAAKSGNPGQYFAEHQAQLSECAKEHKKNHQTSNHP